MSTKTALLLAFAASLAFGCAHKADQTGTSQGSHESCAPKQSVVSDSSAAVTGELKAQTSCPIMGGAIDSTLFVEQNGKRIYVCCTGCIETVKNDFAGAEQKLAKLGQKPETVK